MQADNSSRGSATVHPQVVDNGARRSRRFDFRMPGRAEQFQRARLGKLKRAEARAPNGTDHSWLHGLTPNISTSKQNASPEKTHGRILG
jgi:hypothetical protein